MQNAKYSIVDHFRMIFEIVSVSLAFNSIQFNSHSAICDSSVCVCPAIRKPYAVCHRLCIGRPKTNVSVCLFTLVAVVHSRSSDGQLNGNQLGNFTFISVVKNICVCVQIHRYKEKEKMRTVKLVFIRISSPLVSSLFN